MLELHFILLGFAVAALVAMTGVGGGSLMAPILVLGMGVPTPIAVGTDLLYAAATKVGALWFYWRQGRVRWRIAGRMMAGSIPAAVLAIGAIWLVRSDIRRLSTVISVALSTALALSACAIFARDRLYTTADGAQQRPRFGNPAVMVLLAGAAVGVLVSLSSVGAGAIGVAALLLIYPAVEVREIIGTDLAHGVALAGVAAAGHTMMGNVDYAMLANLLIGMVPGVYLGGRLAGRLPEAMVRKTISVLLLGTAFKLVA